MKFALAISMCAPSHYLPLARAADESGWDSVCVPEGGPWTEETTRTYDSRGPSYGNQGRWWGPDTPFLDPFVVIPAMAAVTERIRFYTNVYKLPLHSPLLIARTLASAWALAPGRIAIGVGLGWNVQEFEAVGVDFATRGPRTDETLEILRRFRPGEWVEHHGRFYDIPRLQQAPAIPEELRIFVGGDSPAALRRAARFGDGWCSRAPSVEAVVELIPRVQDALAEAGRSSEGFEIFAMCPEATDIETVDRLSRAGVTEVQLWPWLRYGVDAADLEGKLDSVRRFARDVIEPLRSGAGR